jgi:hypothetical protein
LTPEQVRVPFGVEVVGDAVERRAGLRKLRHRQLPVVPAMKASAAGSVGKTGLIQQPLKWLGLKVPLRATRL